MKGPWRNGKVPISAVGSKVELWSKVDTDSWFRAVGMVINLEDEPCMNPQETDLMEFREKPPAPTEGAQLWRVLDA